MAKFEMTQDDRDDLLGYLEDNYDQRKAGRLNNLISHAKVYGEYEQP